MGNANDIMSDAIIDKQKNLSISGFYKILSEKSRDISIFSAPPRVSRSCVKKTVAIVSPLLIVGPMTAAPCMCQSAGKI